MHDLKSLPSRCNRAVLIDEGRKVFDGAFYGCVSPRNNLAHVYKNQTWEPYYSGIIEDITVRGEGCHVRIV